MRLEWARQLRDHCTREGVSFFLKQLGGFPNKRGADRALLDGRLWRQMPEPARRADTTDSRRRWTYAVS
jgi:protein gp37